MTENYEELKKLFEKIKNSDWIESHRKGDTGIGKTFEDLLDKEEDNLALPDFKDIEVKSKRNESESMITLFTKSPNYPKGVNTVLRENFGSISEEYNNRKILHTTIGANNFNSHRSGFDFKIKIDKENKKLILQVKEHATNKIVYEEAYWSFDTINKALSTKLKYIALVGGDEKKENNVNYFRYTDIRLIVGLTLDKFLEALENGDILVDIRIGVYNSGPNIGKTHDHGTGFRIKLNNLLKYATVVQ